MVVLVIIAILLGAYWAGPFPHGEDGVPEPERQKLSEKQQHAARIDKGVEIALKVAAEALVDA